MSSASSVSGKRLFGLITREQRWGLSWRGYAALLGLLTVAALIWFCCVYSFLAITERVEARYLAVEGWVHSYAIKAAANEFRSGGYERVFTTGGPVEGVGIYINDYSTAANIGASRLEQAGLAPGVIQAAPAKEIARDRTFTAARALKLWFDEHRVPLTSLNIVTADVHARRTRLLFQKAFGPEVKIGIIAVQNPDYDAGHWWRYSQGVRSVLGECIAYGYAKFFFFPDSGTGKPASASR